MVARWRAMARYTRPAAGDAARRASPTGGSPACRRCAGPSTCSRSVLDSPVEDWPLLEPARDAADVDGLERVARTSRVRGALSAVVADEIRPAFIRAPRRARRRDAAGRAPGRRARDVRGPRRRRGLSQPHPDAHLARRRRRDSSTASATPRSSGSTRRSLELAGRTLGTTTLADALVRAARRPDAVLHLPRRGVREGRGEPRRAQRGAPAWFGRLAAAACDDPRDARPRGGARGDAYYRAPATDGSRPGQYVVNTVEPHGRGRATRPRRSRTTRPCRATTSRSRWARSSTGLPDVPAPPRADGLRRGLGPVHRAAGRRDGPLLGRPRPARDAVVRRLARGPARRRHRHPRDGLAAPAGHRLHARPHGPRAAQHRQRGRPVHRAGRARRSPTSRPAGAAAPPRARRRARLGPAFDIRGFHDAMLSDGALPLPTLARRRREPGRTASPHPRRRCRCTPRRPGAGARASRTPPARGGALAVRPAQPRHPRAGARRGRSASASTGRSSSSRSSSPTTAGGAVARRRSCR